MTAVSTRLVRLLNMVPYFQANPRITYAEAATDLGVSVKQLRDDLNQLWMCGLPGYGPGDLIDFEFSGDTIEVTFTAGIDHPLRLTSPEATGVLVALRALLDVPGMVDPEAARSAIAKIESAAGTLGQGAEAAVDEPAPAESEAAAAVRAAVRNGRALAIEYYSASHDMLSSRVVDPSAWCWWPTTATWRRGAGRPRGCGCSGSTASSTPRCSTSRRLRPPPAVQAGPDTSLFDADPSLPSATLLIDRSASWMFDYYPLRVMRELPDGACEAAMTYASDEWMARFVLGFGSAVRVLEPESLAQRVRESATAALRRLRGRCGQHRRVDSVQTSGGDQIGWSTTLALVNRYRRVRAALRRQEAAGRGPLAGQVDADLQVRDQRDAVRLQAGCGRRRRPRRSPPNAPTPRLPTPGSRRTNARPDPGRIVSAA